jgi:hypothetical protein
MFIYIHVNGIIASYILQSCIPVPNHCRPIGQSDRTTLLATGGSSATPKGQLIVAKPPPLGHWRWLGYLARQGDNRGGGRIRARWWWRRRGRRYSGRRDEATGEKWDVIFSRWCGSFWVVSLKWRTQIRTIAPRAIPQFDSHAFANWLMISSGQHMLVWSSKKAKNLLKGIGFEPCLVKRKWNSSRDFIYIYIFVCLSQHEEGMPWDTRSYSEMITRVAEVRMLNIRWLDHYATCHSALYVVDVVCSPYWINGMMVAKVRSRRARWCEQASL